MTGTESIEGNTAHIGPQIAAVLNIPQLTYVKKIQKIEKKLKQLQQSIYDR